MNYQVMEAGVPTGEFDTFGEAWERSAQVEGSTVAGYAGFTLFSLDGNNSYIIDPGKFELEPEYVPCFWDIYLEGFYLENEEGDLVFLVEEGDIARFPQLKGKKEVVLKCGNDGHVMELS